MNIVFENKVKYISQKWNYARYSTYIKSSDNISKDEKPIIIHYTGKFKGDNYLCNHTHSYLYSYYYKEFTGEKFKFKNKNIKSIIIKIFKNNIKKIYKKK